MMRLRPQAKSPNRRTDAPGRCSAIEGLARSVPRVVIIVGVFVASLDWAPQKAIAQLSSEQRNRLVDSITAASDGLDPDRLPNLKAAEQEFLSKVGALPGFLDRITDSENRDAWLRYINTAPVVDAIEGDESPATVAREALELRDRLIGTTPGLEMSALVDLRRATETLVDAVVFRNREQSVMNLQGQLESLSKTIKDLGEYPTPTEFASISARVSLLASAHQADELVELFRETFRYPNASILVGSSLVDQAISRPVVRERPVRDCILGTRLVGVATMTGEVSASLLPSSDSAKVHLEFVGKVVSNSRGFNGPIRLRTIGDGDVHSTRTMTVDAKGIDFGETTSDAVLDTRIKCIENKLAIVRAIAMKQARRQKAAADRIALAKLEQQVTEQFSSETGQVTPVTPSELLDRAEPMLKRLSLERPTQSWNSTERAIFADVLFRSADQLGAAVPRPTVSGPFEFAMQIHESAVENAFSIMLAGRTLNEKRLNELLERIGPSESSPSSESDEEPPFEISFSRSRPVIFEAREERVRIGLRGTRFTQGKRSPLVKPMEITAVYQPEVDENGRKLLRRTGEVEVNFPRQRLRLGEVGLKRIIQREFSELFPEAILDQPLRIRDDAKVQTLRGREFYPREIESENGWLSIAFQ